MQSTTATPLTATAEPAPANWQTAPLVARNCCICHQPLETGQDILMAFAGIHTACAIWCTGRYINGLAWQEVTP